MTEVTRKDNIISRGLQGCHRSEMSIRVHSWATSLQANSLLYGTIDVLVGFEGLSPLAFLKIGGADARSVQKTPAGVLFVRRGLFFVKRRRRCLAHECTSVYIRGLRVCKQTRYCSISRTSLSVLKSLLPLAFLKIDGTDTRREQK